MDAAKSERAALFGSSEGGYMSMMYAATHPERTTALILFGCYAKESWAPDYPWGRKPEEYFATWNEELVKNWGGPFQLDKGAPSVANDEAARSWFGAYLRHSASPGAALALSDWNFAVDVRGILPSIRVPTLILHRSGDRWYQVAEAQYLADHIPGAKLVILPGNDHISWWGDQDRLFGEIQEFLIGNRNALPAERVLLTIAVTDIVGSTEKAATLGDQKWKDLLQFHDTIVRREVMNFGGQEINNTGDGFVLAFTGPTRAIQCVRTIRQELEQVGLAMRAGLHAGECERRENNLSGLAINIASRISARALPGNIFVSNTVKDLAVGSDIRFAEQGLHPLKGLSGDWPIYSVTA
jgi:class 3 adenylate cyclase